MELLDLLLFPLLKLAEVFSKDGMSFLASCQNLVPRPWVIDDLDTFKLKWSKKSWKKASILCMLQYISLEEAISLDMLLM